MKTKLRRVSKRSLSMVLSVFVLLSCMVIGQIPVHAYNNFTMIGNFNNWTVDNNNYRSQNGYLYYDLTDYIGKTIYFKASLDGNWSGPSGSGDVSVTTGSNYTLQWNSGQAMKYTVKHGYVGFRCNNMTFNFTDADPVYKLYNSSNVLGTFTHSNSSNVFTTTATLAANTTYSLSILNTKTSKYYRDTSTLTAGTEGVTLYRYNDSSSNTVSFKSGVAGTYTFKWTQRQSEGSDLSDGNYDGTLTVTAPTTYTISYNKGTYGTGTNTTDTKVKDVELTLKNAIFTRAGYAQTGWSTTAAGTTKAYDLGGTYTANASTTLYPYWERTTCDITFAQPTNGSITYNNSTASPVTINYGSDASLVIAANDGYVIESLTDGSAVSAAVDKTSYTYTISNIENDHTISATMKARTYTVTCGGENVNYTTNPTSGTYNSTVTFKVAGTDSTYVITDAPTGKYVDKDGVEHSITITSDGNGQYHFTQPKGNVTITTNAVKTPRTVKLSLGAHVNFVSAQVGTTSYTPNSSNQITVSDGSSLVVTVSYDDGYEYNNSTTGFIVGGTNSTTFTKTITGNTTLSVNAKAKKYMVTFPTDSSHYSFNKTTGSYDYASTINYTITPVDGYYISNVTGTGVTYNSSNNTGTVTVPLNGTTLSVSYGEYKYNVTATAENGTINQGASTNPGKYTTATVKATPNAGYKFKEWVTTGGVTYTSTAAAGDTTQVTATINATAAGTIKAVFEPVYHTINYSADNAAFSDKTTSAYVGQTVSFKVKADKGYTITAVSVAPSQGSGITPTEGSTDSNGYTTYTFTMPANSSATYYVNVTATTTAITPTINVTYYTSETATTTKSSGSGTTSSRKSETISFTNASSYPAGTAFKIYDGSTELYSGTNSGTTSITRQLQAGTHTLKVSVIFANTTLNTSTVTLTVNQAREVTVKSPKYGGKITATYTNDFGTANQTTTPNADTTNTIYVKSGSNVTVSKNSGSGTLADVYFNNTSKGTSAFAVSSDGAITALFKSAVTLRGTIPNTTWDGVPMYYNDNEASANWVVTKVNVTSAGTYQFKIHDGTNWYGYGTSSDGGSVITDETSSTGVTFNSGDSYKNAGFKATTTGNYTFKFNTSTHKVIVEMPLNEHDITYSGSNYTTDGTNPSIATYKEDVTINAVAASGYYIDSVTVTKETDSASVSVTDNGNDTYSFKMPDDDITVKINTSKTYDITYYVDLHTNANVPKISIMDGNGTGASAKRGKANITMTQQQSSTVYAATIATPIAGSSGNYSGLYVKVEAGDESSILSLATNQISSYLMSSKTLWIEAANEKSLTLTPVYKTNTSTAVSDSTKKRIYVARPSSWASENMGVYYWGSVSCTDWDHGVKMTKIGTDSSYAYYYVDVPKEMDNFIVQGWGANTSIGNYSKSQTNNIENITSTENYFVLKEGTGDNYDVDKRTTAELPSYTRYVESVGMNVDEITNNGNVNIKPTYKGGKITYSSNNPNIVVNSEGYITSVAKGTANITVKIYSEVGAKATSLASGNGDVLTFTISVTVNDPNVFEGFKIMSYNTKISTISIPLQSGNQPGYIDSISTYVTGVTNVDAADKTGYASSAILTPTPSSGNAVSYTVEYAAPNNIINGYSDIRVNLKEITTKSNHHTTTGQRYGYDHWEIDGVNGKDLTPKIDAVSQTDSNGVETATTSNFVLSGTTYNIIFDEYTYVDVTFNFKYYEYNTTRKAATQDANGNTVYVDKEYYQYDKDYVGNETIGASGWNTVPSSYEGTFDRSQPTHIERTYKVTDHEVREKTSAGINKDNLIDDGNIADALKDGPENSYYNYTLNSSSVKTITRNGPYKATVDVVLQHTPKTYVVKLNGTQKYYNDNGNNRNFYYQEYADLSVNTDSVWKTTNAQNQDIANAVTMATGKSYRFRVTDNTYLKTSAYSATGNDLEDAEKDIRCAVDYSGHEITHEAKKGQENSQNPDLVEKIINNFYIADFFDPSKVLDPDSDPNNSGTHIPYDDVKFVGGGVMYYSLDHSTQEPNQSVVDYGFVNDDGTADKDALTEFIKDRIQENNGSQYADGDTDLANAVAYGTEIEAKVYKENNRSTGLVYRYLPYESYDRDNQGAIIKDPTTNEYKTTINSNTFRYSNALKAYQYIYASKAENKATNDGKDMRLYAYYIYSYTKYDNDTGIPYTDYKVVISDSYADASTYWNNPV